MPIWPPLGMAIGGIVFWLRTQASEHLFPAEQRLTPNLPALTSRLCWKQKMISHYRVTVIGRAAGWGWGGVGSVSFLNPPENKYGKLAKNL